MTRSGKGFRFEYEILREPSKRMGRKLVNLRGKDETIAVIPEDGALMAIASDSGNILVFPTDDIPILSGPAQGVRMIKLKPGTLTVGFKTADEADKLEVKPTRGKLKTLSLKRLPVAKRAGQGKSYCSGIVSMERVKSDERHD